MARAPGTKKQKKDGGNFRDEPLTADLLERLLREVRKPLSIDDFLRVLALPRRRKKNLEAYLHALMDSGKVIRLGGGGYVLAGALKKCAGVLSVQRSGIGFVTLDPPHRGEAFISQHHLGQAWHGDRVEVILFPHRRQGKNREGRVARVIERAVKELVVRVLRNTRDGVSVCEATDPRISAVFLADISALQTAPPPQSLLRVRPGAARGPELWEAAVLAVLGDEGDSSVQEELVKANHGVPRAFVPDALKEAALLPKTPGKAEFADRRDLSRAGFVTIDGATAKDFDDAVHVAKTRSGYTLRVAIADVAHYVRPGSALDGEAYLRGNSYYFPRSVEPMLPEALSNGLCSLNPGEPRLVMVVEIVFSPRGEAVSESMYPAWIVSAARLTYDQVRDALILGQEEARRSMAAHLPMLEDALALAHILADVRREKGALDFDLPEPECVFDENGDLVGMAARESHFAHTLIEMFMVAANEAAARFLTARNVPCLYRAHPAPDPDKLRTLFTVLEETDLLPRGMRPGARGGPPPTPKMLQALLDAARGTPHEYLVSRVALRSMMQAGYTPELEGHFGLASACYCHFTSPIRRYADLVAHRALKAALDTRDKAPLPGRGKLQAVADHINATERTAMEAEREIYRRMSIIFMSGHVGETYDGVVSGVTDFGIFVELDGVMAEGMIRLAAMDDDYYVFYPDRHELRGERTGNRFRMGRRVSVTIMDVNAARLEINLALARPAGEEKPHGGKAARGGKRGGKTGKGAGKKTRQGAAALKNGSARQNTRRQGT